MFEGTPFKMLSQGMVLPILVVATVVGLLRAADVDDIVDFCVEATQMFAENEHDFTRKYERSLKEPDLYFPQKKELKFRAYEIEKRQRPFECITNYFNGSSEELDKSQKYQDLVKQCKSKKSRPVCDPDYPYRTIDGTCNNLDNPDWGSVLSCGKRLFPASYEGAAGPRKSVCRNRDLPSPRYIVKHYLSGKTHLIQFSAMHLLYFGQFVSHDIGDTPVTFVEDKPLDCCSNLDKGVVHPQCAPILIDEDDDFYSKHHVKCHGFVRSAICDTCSVGPRSQMNEHTAFLDLSQVYAPTKLESKKLRKFDGSGQMRVQETAHGDLLPIDETIDPNRCGNLRNHVNTSEVDYNKGNRKCKEDEDCESNEICHKPQGECFDLCDNLNPCGEGAICNAVNHLPECKCPEGSTGDPYLECSNQEDQVQNRTRRDIFQRELNSFKQKIENDKEYCFKAGDRRGNQHSALMSYHTLFVREHNRIARKLKKINRHWTEEKIYQEARKINIAQYQMIVFNEFLRVLLGHDIMSEYGLWIADNSAKTEYDPNVDPTIVTEFSTAAYRLHSMIDFKITLFRVCGYGSSYLRDLYQNASPLHNGKIERLLLQMGYWPYQNYDKNFAKDITQFLYKELRGHYGFDLASVNIQRGRDNGIESYVNVIKQLHDIKDDIKDFDDLLPFMDKESIKQLQQIYCDVKDIDLWLGLYNERKEKEKLLPPTPAKIIAGQFRKLKFGDRFYFEHAKQFTDEQLIELKHASFAKIMCDNSNLFFIQPRVMEFPRFENHFTLCNHFPEVDLEKWREFPEIWK